MAVAIVVLGLAVLAGGVLVGALAIDLVPTDRGLTYLLASAVLFGSAVVTLALGLATLHLTRVLRQPVQMLSADEDERTQEGTQSVLPQKELQGDARMGAVPRTGPALGSTPPAAPEATSTGLATPPAMAEPEAPARSNPAAAWSKRLFPGLGASRRTAIAEEPGAAEPADVRAVADAGHAISERDLERQSPDIDVSKNDVSKKVSQNDVSKSDVSKNDVSKNDVSKNDNSKKDGPDEVATKDVATKDIAFEKNRAWTDATRSGEPGGATAWRSFDPRMPNPAAPEHEPTRTAPQQGDLWAAPSDPAVSDRAVLPDVAEEKAAMPPQSIAREAVAPLGRSDAPPPAEPEPATMPQRRFAALTAFRTRARAVLDPERAADESPGAAPQKPPVGIEPAIPGPGPASAPAGAPPATTKHGGATEDALAAVSSALDLDLEPAPLRPPVGVEVVGAYESGGVRYTMYANGVVTAEGAGGMDVFESLDALRKHLDATAGRLA